MVNLASTVKIQIDTRSGYYVTFTNDLIESDLTISWGRDSIESAPKNRTLTCTLKWNYGAEWVRHLSLGLIKVEYANGIQFLGIVESVSIPNFDEKTRKLKVYAVETPDVDFFPDGFPPILRKVYTSDSVDLSEITSWVGNEATKLGKTLNFTRSGFVNAPRVNESPYGVVTGTFYSIVERLALIEPLRHVNVSPDRKVFRQTLSPTFKVTYRAGTKITEREQPALSSTSFGLIPVLTAGNSPIIEDSPDKSRSGVIINGYTDSGFPEITWRDLPVGFRDHILLRKYPEGTSKYTSARSWPNLTPDTEYGFRLMRNQYTNPRKLRIYEQVMNGFNLETAAPVDYSNVDRRCMFAAWEGARLAVTGDKVKEWTKGADMLDADPYPIGGTIHIRPDGKSYHDVTAIWII